MAAWLLLIRKTNFYSSLGKGVLLGAEFLERDHNRRYYRGNYQHGGRRAPLKYQEKYTGHEQQTSKVPGKQGASGSYKNS